MRAPVSWLHEFLEVPTSGADLGGRRMADALVRVGLEIERVESDADAITGPLVVGRVAAFTDEPQRNGKVIRWCQVDVGEAQSRGIVCGANNFAVSDLVVVALPGAVLPGGFAISARKTYGHVSDGMICSARELGIGDDHAGILVLPPGSGDPGADGLDALGLRETVLDMAVTPDRGYCLSMRGIAREVAAALEIGFTDLALALPEIDGQAYPITVDDRDGCDMFSARAVTGLDPAAPTPTWMARRLRQCGMRPISLPVDVANYVMLETGQPLHTFDRAKLAGAIGVRRAVAGEKLVTLDAVVRALDPDDLVVTDDTGPIALAGVMGGASTEIDGTSTEIVLEAAHWQPASISRAVRRHKLPSEAAKRFERGVDPAIAGIALQRCVDLLVEHGGARPADGYTVVGTGPVPPLIALLSTRPADVAGMPISRDAVIRRLSQVGCAVDGADVLQIRPPSWRPDLTDPADLVEEVVRLEDYDRIPSVLPTPPPGRGLTDHQRLRRAVSHALAGAGHAEVLSSVFVAPAVHDVFGLAANDPRRRAARVANPLSDAEPELRTSLLPGLIATAHRNVGRGNRSVAIFEIGAIFVPKPDAPPMPRPGVTGPPSEEQLRGLDAGLPDQPRHVGVLLCGDADLPGWWGRGRPADWSDAVAAARVVADAARVQLEVRNAAYPPWHPGRCAELRLHGQVIGHAGELHPGTVAAFGLPERTCAMELDLDAFSPPPPARAPVLSTFPPVLLDVALVVPDSVPAAEVSAALQAGAGPLLESLRLFDVFADPAKVGPGHRSMAFALVFRAPDRTLTVAEAAEFRDAAVTEAMTAVGARLRS